VLHLLTNPFEVHTYELRIKETSINFTKGALLAASYYVVMSDLPQPLHEEIPDRVVAFPIEPSRIGETEWSRKATQRFLPFHIEIKFEVRKDQLPHGTKDRLSQTETWKVRLGNRPPTPSVLVHADHVVVVAYRTEIYQKRGKPMPS
jgi:hypothetical protein